MENLTTGREDVASVPKRDQKRRRSWDERDLACGGAAWRNVAISLYEIGLNVLSGRHRQNRERAPVLLEKEESSTPLLALRTLLFLFRLFLFVLASALRSRSPSKLPSHVFLPLGFVSAIRSSSFSPRPFRHASLSLSPSSSSGQNFASSSLLHAWRFSRRCFLSSSLYTLFARARRNAISVDARCKPRKSLSACRTSGTSDVELPIKLGSKCRDTWNYINSLNTL